MENKLTKIRRIFAIQLVRKHRLKLTTPNCDATNSTVEMFITEMLNQLCAKLCKQEKFLFDDDQDRSSHCPLVVQRKQLKKDLEDFDILQQGQDRRRLQQIIERVEHMDMFNRTFQTETLQSSNSSCQQIETPLMINRIDFISTKCSYQTFCQEFLDHLDWPSELFAREYDRCFCQICYSPTMPNICQTNVENRYPMIIPRNWVKFGLKVDEVHAKIHQIWHQWSTSYHGTLPHAALSMVKHRQICLPGDKLSDGTQLTIRPGHIQHQKAFFSSPTIRYAAQNHYATPINFTSHIDKCVYTAQIVLRCRQMPGSFVVQPETLNNSQTMEMDFCDFIPNDRIEWKTEQRGTVVFDGLCVRLKRLTGLKQTNRIQQTYRFN